MSLPVRLAKILYTAVICIGANSNLVESVATTVNPAIYQYICPHGWDLVSEGQCRGLVETDSNVPCPTAYEKVVDICSGLDAVPPIVRNAQDHKYWRSKSTSSTSNNCIVIGIICDEKSKKWIWMDGTTIDFKPTSYDSVLDGSCSGKTGVWYYHNEIDNWYYSTGTFSTLLIYCTSDLKKPEIREDDCIQFDHGDSNSMCYQVSQEVVLWSDAQDKCKMVGANLASIHSDQENSYIRRLATSKGLVNGLHLGATVTGKSNTFGWIDGSAWDYTHFLPGFPVPGIGDCLFMSTGDVNGEWANTACTSKFPFVCSRKPFTDSPPNFCRGADIKEGDIVRTPGFPADASTYCDFILQVDPGKLVEIEVLLLEANNCCDHFVLYEASSTGYDLIANLTGAISGPKFRTTSSNFMRASWQPNGGVNVRGAMFTFRGV